MNIQKICVVFFSPTGGVEKAARIVAGELGRRLNLEPEYINFTKPEARRQDFRFGRLTW